MMKWIVLLGLLGAGGGTAFYVYNDKAATAKADGPEAMLHEVKRGDLNITITENGTLMAKESQKVSPGIRGRGKIMQIIEEGAVVEEGELLCTLDTTELQTAVEQLELEIVKAEADLNTAKTELEIQQTENVAAIEKAKIDVEKAEKELEKYKEGDSPKQQRELDIAIKDANTSFKRAEKRYQDSILLEKQNYINHSQLEEDEILYEKAKVQKEGSELDLRIYETFTNPMALKDKETALTDACRSLETAEKRGQSTLRQKEVAVEQHQTRLDKLKKQLTEKKEEIDKMTLKAPCPGIVIYGDPNEWWDREEIRVGGEIWGNNTIMTIPDLRVMQVKLQIHEADIGKIDKELLATVTMDTYPGLKLTGKVTKVAAIAGSGQPWENDTEVKKFDIKITLDRVEGVELKPGISAKSEIFIEKKVDVIAIPLQCVFIEEGEQFCYTMDAGQPTRRPIKTGSSNDSMAEVVEGLSVGDMVLLYNPNLPVQKGGEDTGADEPVDEDPEPGLAQAGS